MRGPQGTLFGPVGGRIRYVTNSPGLGSHGATEFGP